MIRQLQKRFIRIAVISLTAAMEALHSSSSFVARLTASLSSGRGAAVSALSRCTSASAAARRA